MKDERDNERQEKESENTGERDLRYGDAFGTQRDRSAAEEDGYLDPESGRAEGDSTGGPEGTRNLRYGDAFGTQRDRSKQEEGGYLDAEFGSREFDRPGEKERDGPDEAEREE